MIGTLNLIKAFTGPYQMMSACTLHPLDHCLQLYWLCPAPPLHKAHDMKELTEKAELFRLAISQTLLHAVYPDPCPVTRQEHRASWKQAAMWYNTPFIPRCSVQRGHSMNIYYRKGKGKYLSTSHVLYQKMSLLCGGGH